jgi:hypothetical protein
MLLAIVGVSALEIEMEKYPVENMTVNNNTWIGYCDDFTQLDNYSCVAAGKIWTRGNNASGFYTCDDVEGDGCIKMNASNVFLDGMGAIIKGNQTSGSNGIYRATSSMINGTIIMNLTLSHFYDGIELLNFNNTQIINTKMLYSTMRSLYLNRANNTIINNITCYNSTSFNLYTLNSRNITIDNSFFNESKYQNYDGEYTFNLTIMNSIFNNSHSGTYMISVTNNTNFTFANNVLYSVTAGQLSFNLINSSYSQIFGNKVYNSGWNAFDINSDYVSIYSNYAENYTHHCLDLYANSIYDLMSYASHIDFWNNTCVGNNHDINSDNAIYIATANNINIYNNTLSNSSNNAIGIDGNHTHTFNISIYNNILKDIDEYCIYTGVPNVFVSNNTFINCGISEIQTSAIQDRRSIYNNSFRYNIYNSGIARYITFSSYGNSNYTVLENSTIFHNVTTNNGAKILFKYNGLKNFTVENSTITLNKIGSNYSLYNVTRSETVFTHSPTYELTVNANEQYEVSNEDTCLYISNNFNISPSTRICDVMHSFNRTESPIFNMSAYKLYNLTILRYTSGVTRLQNAYNGTLIFQSDSYKNITINQTLFFLKNLTNTSTKKYSIVQIFNSTQSTPAIENVNEYNATLDPNNRTLVFQFETNRQPTFKYISTNITDVTYTYTTGDTLRIGCTGTGMINITNLTELRGTAQGIRHYKDGAYVDFITDDYYVQESCSEHTYTPYPRPLSEMSPQSDTIVKRLMIPLTIIAILAFILYPVVTRKYEEWDESEFISYFIKAMIIVVFGLVTVIFMAQV